jgi:hypothetical protein
LDGGDGLKLSRVVENILNSTEQASEYTYFFGKGNDNHELGMGFWK